VTQFHGLRTRPFAAALLGALFVAASVGPASVSAGAPPSLSLAPVAPIVVTTTGPAAYSFGTIVGEVSQTFSLTNGGGSATSALVVSLTGSAAYAKSQDRCTAISLGPKKSCAITIRYTPASSADTATLTAMSTKPKASTTISLSGAKGISTTLRNAANAVIPAGGSVAAGVVVHDTATVDAGLGNTIPVGTSMTFRRFATIDCTGAHTDQVVAVPSGSQTATVSSAAFTPTAGRYAFDATFSGGGVVGAGTSSCEPFTIVDASIAISPASSSPTVGDAVVLTIAVTALPSGASRTFTSITPSVSPDPSSTSSTCGAPAVSGNLATCTVTINSDTAATYSVGASASLTVNGVALNRTTAGPAGPDGTGPASVAYSLAQSADLSITKTDATTAVAAGTANQYTIVVENHGPLDVTGAWVTDVLPVGLVNVTSPSLPAGVTFVNDEHGQLTWSGIALASGGSMTLLVSGLIDPALAPGSGSFVETATVHSPAAIPDANAANNTATDTDDLHASVDLGLSITDGLTSVVPGTTDAYTLTVTNDGPGIADDVTVVATLPTGFSVRDSFLVPAGATFHALAGGQVSWTGLAIGPGDSVSLNLTGTIDPSLAAGSGTFSLSATVSPAAGVTDLNGANDSATDTDSVSPTATLFAEVTVEGGASHVANLGDVVTIGVRVGNAGPSSATGVVVSDLLPAGLTFVDELVPASTSADPNTGTWTVGTIVPGQTVVLLVRATVGPIGTTVPSSIIVSASASADDASAALGSATVNVNAALQVVLQAKAGDTFSGTPDNRITAGSDVTYRLIVANSGGTTATNVTVTALLPANFTFLSFANPSPDVQLNGSTLTWTLASLAAGSGFLIDFTMATNSPSSPELDLATASVTSDETNQYGSANPAAMATSWPLEVWPSGDLGITLDDGLTTAPVGTVVTYTIGLTNAGPSDVGSATVTVAVPVGLTNVGTLSLPPGVTFTDHENGTVTWTGLSMTSGVPVTLSLSGMVGADAGPGSLTTVATVSTPSGVSDPVSGNNSAADTDTVP
jgi:uncharacterized repeat protein (TIGR01451 family)